ncbi:MAG: hypothetical protein GX066_02515 [Clostridiaceae bacterium]|nr:hypothetical protein [Clostridiaceae bacterium]
MKRNSEIFNSVFVLVAVGICITVVIVTFMGQFDDTYSEEVKDKLILYAHLIANDIKKDFDADRVSSRVIEMMNKIEGESGIEYRFMIKNNGKYQVAIENNQILDKESRKEINLVYADTIENEIFSAGIKDGYKPGYITVAVPVQDENGVAAVLELSMSGREYELLFTSTLSTICICYGVISFIVMFLTITSKKGNGTVFQWGIKHEEL